MLFAWGLLGFCVISILLGAPMILGFTAAGLIPVLAGGTGYSLADLVSWIIAGNSNTYLAVAFFVVSGNIMSRGDISAKVYELFAYFLGDKKGFLPICALITAVFYGMVSGSAVAVTAAVGTLCLPILTRVGYQKNYFAALLCAAGCLGMVIPPSTVIITVGVLIGLEDMTPSYRLAMLIGLTCAVFLMVLSLVHTKKDQGNRDLILKEHQERRKKGLAKVFCESIWALLIPVIILGGIFSNLLTANEAAAVSVVYCSIIAVYVYKTMTWKGIWQTILASVKTFGPLCILQAVGVSFSKALAGAGINEFIGTTLSNVSISQGAFLLFTVFVVSILGFFMSGSQVVTPILLPLALQVNVNLELWCVIMSAVSSFSLLTPPYGYGLMIMAPVANIPVGDLFKKCLPFWLGLTAISVIFAVFPGLSMWLL